MIFRTKGSKVKRISVLYLLVLCLLVLYLLVLCLLLHLLVLCLLVLCLLVLYLLSNDIFRTKGCLGLKQFSEQRARETARFSEQRADLRLSSKMSPSRNAFVNKGLCLCSPSPSLNSICKALRSEKHEGEGEDEGEQCFIYWSDLRPLRGRTKNRSVRPLGLKKIDQSDLRPLIGPWSAPRDLFFLFLTLLNDQSLMLRSSTGSIPDSESNSNFFLFFFGIELELEGF